MGLYVARALGCGGVAALFPTRRVSEGFYGIVRPSLTRRVVMFPNLLKQQARERGTGNPSLTLRVKFKSSGSNGGRMLAKHSVPRSLGAESSL